MPLKNIRRLSIVIDECFTGLIGPHTRSFAMHKCYTCCELQQRTHPSPLQMKALFRGAPPAPLNRIVTTTFVRHMGEKYLRKNKMHGKYRAIINDVGDAAPEYQTSPLLNFGSREALAAEVSSIASQIQMEAGADLNKDLRMKFKVRTCTTALSALRWLSSPFHTHT
jgi:hypothetical protein